jgi:uncharacterized protein (DUF983 family)
MLWRGCTRRCPRCGTGSLFRRWFEIVPDCPGCGLHFEREAGYWIGAMAVNIIVTTGILAVGFATALALTIPDVPVVPLLVIFVPLALALPIALYPHSKTIWLAIDRGVLQRLDRHEPTDEQVRHI